MGYSRQKGRPLFRTHEAPYQATDWAVGQIVEHEGGLYRVTRWVELPPIPLERGGSVGEWEVWGRRLSSRKLRQEIAGAADAILDQKSANEG